MKLYIICEGQSEQAFVDHALAPYLYANGCQMEICAPILKSPKVNNQSHKGGRITFLRIKSYIEKFLKQEQDCFITTFIDFYALGNDFPGYKEAQIITDLYNKIASLEQAFIKEINNKRVIPYLQIHEFETLYFADSDTFTQTDDTLDTIALKHIKKNFEQVNAQFINPEEINNSHKTAPSKRIEQFFESIQLKYKKPYYATLYAQSCNIKILREKCQHFNTWINQILTYKL